ncbi:exo-beta-N-acetylmuramidase NamZ domain-containing protein [Paraglaciecola sp.]|uniref:exo-beta-N-acetylmuramidase NamZ family protein n=1 Tax=Paraglaciecola sp. TaxID=1920173 RepID=UPI00355819C3
MTRTFSTKTLVVFCLVFIASACSTIDTHVPVTMQVGAEQGERYLPLLKNKKVGLVVNQSSLVHDQHLLDYLLANKINVLRIFAPEHGFRGDYDAGAHVKNAIDAKTGVAISSIYGKHKKPSPELMDELDVVIFDIQDVGVRFYTFISSMHYMMEAAAESGTQFMVLDRPNPNGSFVDGPILEPDFQSFVGIHPIPILHGMTLAELARMIKGEGWINQAESLNLVTIANKHYQRDMPYELPVAPSPNLPNRQSIQLYPSLCFFEATPVSIGRGTDFPFQVMGHDMISLGDFEFTPVSKPGSALHPKLENQLLFGTDLRASAIQGLDLSLFIQAFSQFKKAGFGFFERPDFMDKLAGTDSLRLAIQQGQTAKQIKAAWQTDLLTFKQQRKPYLLYPDY